MGIMNAPSRMVRISASLIFTQEIIASKEIEPVIW
jgi:hypothetical protein